MKDRFVSLVFLYPMIYDTTNENQTRTVIICYAYIRRNSLLFALPAGSKLVAEVGLTWDMLFPNAL